MISSASTAGLPVPSPTCDPNTNIGQSSEEIYFKNNWMYLHSIMQINYTTYDVHRGQDTINPNTNHCNVMVLADSNDSDAETHAFHYAYVLGIYHVNVIYTGSRMLDYHARRLEFVWVQWYNHLQPYGSWSACTLDHLSFPPITADSAFGFIDLNDIVRSCHIIPAFHRSHRHGNKRGLSFSARNSSDWIMYYLNQQVMIF